MLLGALYRGAASAASSALLGRLAPPARAYLRRSEAVKEWIAKQDTRVFEDHQNRRGWWYPAALSRRRQAMIIKQKIKEGEIQLEPTVMKELPRMKGTKLKRNRPLRQELIAEKMREMPKLIAAYKEVRFSPRSPRAASVTADPS